MHFDRIPATTIENKSERKKLFRPANPCIYSQTKGFKSSPTNAFMEDSHPFLYDYLRPQQSIESNLQSIPFFQAKQIDI
jgi:hypothetical protein